ncbi:MAG: enoyl-CoA hydratase/isomerase family protein [Nitrososphaerota archaeon]|nr:enoyl-CoA hydratase/isomerase family protein [Nitrososphaerota archaeon]MDG6923500.1 enoyl-CoA hydratase/isomerase family protein [Nitrososphaerota archaeon]
MASEKYTTLKVEDENGITTITLNRPEQKNSLSPTLHDEMLDLMRKLENQDSLRVVILTGAGDSFCAGQDLKGNFLANVHKPVQRRKISNTSHEWGLKFRNLWVPTIAQVNGWCFGAGVRIMSLCDFAIASDKAVFGLSEINFAAFPSVGALWAPAYHLHPRDLVDLAMTGRRIDAQEADRIRLVNRVVPHSELRRHVMELADVLKQKDGMALAMCKEAYNLTRRLDYDDSAKWEAAKFHEKNALQGDTWERALSGFKEKKYRPGLETFKPGS